MVLALPLVFPSALLLLSFAPRVRASATLFGSLVGAALALILWQAVVYTALRRRGLSRSVEVAFCPQHYLQAAVQLSVFLYWGYYWSPVYDHALLILAQLLFAYGFDLLLAWSRRERYVLGFGPFPIIFSVNLFLWFRDDWFYLQFLMIAVGYLGKEFLHWQRDGGDTHVFNPSAFALGLYALALIATGTTDLTWGQSIATTLTLAPRIYTFLFLAGLLVMYRFSITLIAGSAAVVLFAWSSAYFSVTGVPYFVDSDIPAAVFLGLLLLVTDPSTSPRSPLGKTLFGGLYGVGVFALYALLTALGVPTFYDKLLSVPLLNLSVRGIDRIAARLGENSPFIRASLSRSNAVHMAVWVVFFGAMTALGKTDGTHTGDRLPFWIEACDASRSNACDRLMSLEATYCGDNSAWACNELGAHYTEDVLVERDEERAFGYFARGCELRFAASCANLLGREEVVHTHPHVLDLRLLLREGGMNLMEMSEPDLYARACVHGWTFVCGEPGEEP